MHLFAGIGGGLLADLILGHVPVCAVEWDHYCCAVLRERADQGWFPGLHVYEGDVRLFDPSEWAGRVDCIAAGFPCQDLSCAGKGAGIGGARSGLWVEVMRAVDAVRPRYVFLENVPAIRTRGGEAVLAALRERGYRSRCGTLAAKDVGAPHRRERWWCLAVSDSDSGRLAVEWGQDEMRRCDTSRGEPDGLRAPGQVADANNTRPQGRECGILQERPRERTAREGGALADAEGFTTSRGKRSNRCWTWKGVTYSNWWSTEPDVGRVAHGVPSRVDALRGLGDAQVPEQAALAWVLLGGPVNG